MEKQPNVLLLVIDCLRSDRILGENRACKTPNIDKIVAGGTGLKNIFVENSITAPSFSSIFTGRYAGNHGVIGMVGVRLDDEATTMAEIFSANGYETYGETTGPLNPILGVDRGFASYNYRSQHDYYFTEWGEGLLKKFKGKEFVEPWFTLVHFWEAHVPFQVRPEFDKPEFGDHPYDRALSGLDEYIGKILETVDDNTLVILTGDHGECLGELPTDDSLLPYFLKKLNLPPVTAEKHESIEDVTDLMAEEPLLHQFATEMRALTDGGSKKIGFVQRIGLLIKLLKIGVTRYKMQMKSTAKTGFLHGLKQKLNDTLLFLAVLRGNSDAAQYQLVRNSLSEHSLQHGYHIYDYLQNVPVVLNKKGLFSEGKRVDWELRQIDLLPTLIDALGLEAPPDARFDGSSYFPYTQNGEGENRPIFLEARGGAQAEKVFLIRGVRRNGKKIAFAPNESAAPVELYDLKEDPKELKSISGSDEKTAKEMSDEANGIAATFSAGAGAKLSDAENAELVKRLKSLGYM